jgi:hypothetical protein
MPNTFFTGELSAPSWLIKWSELKIIEQIAQGTTGTFYFAEWNNCQVVVEVLANQKLNEPEFLQLMKDQLIMRCVNRVLFSFVSNILRNLLIETRDILIF